MNSQRAFGRLSSPRWWTHPPKSRWARRNDNLKDVYFHTLCPLGNVISRKLSTSRRPLPHRTPKQSFVPLRSSKSRRPPRKRGLQPSSGPLAKQSLGAKRILSSKTRCCMPYLSSPAIVAPIFFACLLMSFLIFSYEGGGPVHTCLWFTNNASTIPCRRHSARSKVSTSRNTTLSANRGSAAALFARSSARF